MKKENENAALLSMFDELVNEVKKNRQAILQLQNTIQQYDVGKIGPKGDCPWRTDAAA